ncbi:MAG: murein hydrolase activator EnvC family protein [Nitrospirota bacterium]
MTRRILIALSVLLALLAASTGSVRAGNREEKKQELQRIKKEMEDKQLKLQRADKRERSILAELERIDRDINAGSAELSRHQRKLREAEAALAEIEKTSTVTAQELERLKQAYGSRLRALYKLSRTGGYALAVLSADSFTTAYRRVRYLGIIAGRDQRTIREYGAALELLATREQDIRETTLEILASRESIKSGQHTLEARRRKKKEILGSVKQEKTVYEATLKDLEESSKNLWAMVRLTEQEKKEPKKTAPEAAGQSGRRLPWPVNGQVLTRFGSQKHPQFGTIIFRRGIDISARIGDEVKAVGGGVVVKADWFRGYGKLVIIDHKDGMYTLYGNLSQVDVNNGDRVESGQVIGRAGDTGSLKGSKLYFEVRRNGEAEDPLLWLAKR